MSENSGGPVPDAALGEPHTHDVVQRELNWHSLRLGRIGSTSAKRVLGAMSTRARLVDQLRYELDLREQMRIALDMQIEQERGDKDVPESVWEAGDRAFEEFREYIGPELNVRALKWGRQMEPRALQAAQLRHDMEFTFPGALEREIVAGSGDDEVRVPLIVSPDAMAGRVPVEVKCPLNEENHVQTFVDGPWEQHGPQLTMHALVAGTNEVLFVSFDPRTNDVPMLYTAMVAIPQEAIDRLRDGCVEIWRHVLKGTSPLDQPAEVPKLF